ncbi:MULTISPECIES: DUF559 domain-containing protein [unclassified Mycobacterium]|uniref:DUF559 domain-containing protein n=1 Tax=unclassified Mycobacterium TaxID=2642494 RepID=UPI0007402D20|nr:MULTISPECIES: DUF559 domain-containing protein [unclassified Mycobacterium]KUH82795.1 hypothetical protein AU186_18690 [Mycobacterium sp. GA-1999]KUH88072.1 hypothetical protein AU185_08545 [Mycobacterium sp. GA-0227b]KUH96496.1 hypothetical protein AU187_12195 [Mycobacterium sp. IS-1556]
MTEIFIGSEAVAAGRLTRHELKRWYRPVFRGVYVPKDVEFSLRDRAIAAWLASRRKGVIAGVAASALHGAPWVDPSQPIELVGVRIRPQPGLIPRADDVDVDEVTRIGGLPVTSRVRTAFDMGRRLHRTEALGRLDALMWNQRYDIDEVAQLGQRHRHAPGLNRLYELLPLVDGGAASIPESRIRLWLHDAGLPRPETQIPVIVGHRPQAWLDMGWREYKVAVEYDGDHHRKNRRQYVKDIARLRMLEALGWIVIRVIAEDKPEDVIARVEAALIGRGCNLDLDDMQRFKRSLAA